MPHKHLICPNYHNHLDDNEVSPVDTPISIHDERCESVANYARKEHETFIEHFQSEIMEVHERSGVKRNEHCC